MSQITGYVIATFVLLLQYYFHKRFL